MGCCFGDSKANQKTLQKSVEIGNYRISIQQQVTQGAYGDIWKCRNANSGSIYAAKQIKLQTEQHEQMFRKQVRWLQKFAHSDRIVHYIGSSEIRDDSYNVGVILTEFYDMSLLDLLKNRKMTPYQIIVILKELLLAVQQIHAQNCIHLDIKPENILIDSSKQTRGRYKVCDFGSCVNGPIQIKGIHKEQKVKIKQYIDANCTMIYRAPELVDIQGFTELIDRKTDIWMIGCIGYLMLYRKHPFECDGSLAIMTGCHKYPVPVQQMNPEQRSLFDLVVDLIKKMLVVSQKDRNTEEQLLQYIDANFQQK